MNEQRMITAGRKTYTGEVISRSSLPSTVSDLLLKLEDKGYTFEPEVVRFAGDVAASPRRRSKVYSYALRGVDTAGDDIVFVARDSGRRDRPWVDLYADKGPVKCYEVLNTDARGVKDARKTRILDRLKKAEQSVAEASKTEEEEYADACHKYAEACRRDPTAARLIDVKRLRFSWLAGSIRKSAGLELPTIAALPRCQRERVLRRARRRSAVYRGIVKRDYPEELEAKQTKEVTNRGEE